MKRLKLFPKTFLVSIGLFAALIILVHALVYTLMPQFYLKRIDCLSINCYFL